VAILAFEPDSTRAATIRHIVCDVVCAQLKVARTKRELMQALSVEMPDLLLLPALLSRADEAELLAHLSTLHNSGHLELLVTPFMFASENPPTAALRGWRRWREQTKRRPQPHACDPRAFAEQLTWSLRRAQEVRQERDARRRLLHELDTLVVPEPVSDVVHISNADRRVHRRFAPNELPGFRAARIKHGPTVRLIDCSEGGALVETDVPLNPDTEAVLEIVGDGQHTVVPFRVVRCHASVVESRVLYWGACAFTEPLELGELLEPPLVEEESPAVDQPQPFDALIKATIARHGSDAAGALMTALEEETRSCPFDPVAKACGDLLEIVGPALRSRRGRDAALALIEERLHAAMPSMTLTFAPAPALITPAGREVLYLRLPAAGDAAPGVLNLELPQGAMLEDWQFRLIKVGTYLASLLFTIPEAEAMKEPEGRDRRRHVRVRARLEGRRLGAITMPLLLHDLSEAGCFVDSLHEELSGKQFMLEIRLPIEGWITVKAEVVCNRPGFGYAVQFVEMSQEIRTCLVREVSIIESQGSPEPSLAHSMIA